MKPLLDLTKTEMNEAELTIAYQFFGSQCAFLGAERQLLSTYSTILETMPVVNAALKCTLTFGASTVFCTNSISILWNVYSEQRHKMLQK